MKEQRFTTEVYYRGKVFSIFMASTPKDMQFFNEDIVKAEKSGHKICVCSDKKQAVMWMEKETGIPAKYLRARLYYYDWQKTLDMGFDSSSKSIFREE